MPTPSREEIFDARSPHSTCPPEDERPNTWRVSEIESGHDELPVAATMIDQRLTTPSDSQRSPSPSTSDFQSDEQRIKQTTMADQSSKPRAEIDSPLSIEETRDGTDQAEQEALGYASGSSSRSNEFSNVRLTPSFPSSFLRPGSKFHGTQQSERQVYDVLVEIKHVDMRESFLCGYLRIQGLTEDNPTLTTYFEGEIIGSKYSFLTQHDDWGSTDKVDLQHWAKFGAFRPFQKQARKGNLYIQGLAQRENIFMRWKELFLVPDHRVKTISGASFEGFYYICFNQCQGTVSGIYFHAKSEKFQQLELKHVEDRGCFPAMEFR